MEIDTATTGREGRIRALPARTAPGLLLAGAVVLVYGETFLWMAGRWLAPGSFYAHGPLVLPVAGFLAWRARKGIRWGEDRRPAAGGALLAGGLLLHLAAVTVRVHFLSGLSLLPVLLGMLLIFGGRTAARRWLVPVLYLLFLIPLPLWLVAELTLSLKLAVTEVAIRSANALGIVAIRDGATVHLASGGSLVVGELCSGLRYSVALLAFGGLVAALSRLPAAGRWVLFGAALPVALTANALRVLALVVFAHRLGAARVTGAVHALTGLSMFAAALLLLYLAARLLPARREAIR